VTDANTPLKVTSHIGRDLLQSAALFKYEWQVAWEYVSNGLQYVDSGVSPVVTVNIDQGQKRMVFKDNGRGMNLADLKNYFTMHGENIDTKAGRPGRGMFGTGKSAAFGIANKLRLTTVKNGKRSQVELDRSEIMKPQSSHIVPIKVLESEMATDEPNGTIIEVCDINLKSIDTSSITREIEKHIAFWKGVKVYVGTHECQYIEPSIRSEVVLSASDSPFSAILGSAVLRIAVSKAPLAREQQGIAITSNGVLHESTLSGQEKRQFSNYIFGSIDVPSIATDKSPIPPFDMSRSGQLNPKNELVRATMAFVGMKLEEVLQGLEEEERLRKQNEDSKRLQKEADAIANIINQDFKQWKVQIQNVLAHTVGANDYKPSIISDDDEFDVLAGKGDQPATIVSSEGGPSDIHDDIVRPKNPDPEPENSAPVYQSDANGQENVGKKRKDSAQKSKGGGFSVEFREMGEHEPRAKYEAAERSILVNLEHPQLAAALNVGGIDDVAFRRLAYEVAFAEYSIALSFEMANDGHFTDPQGAITSVREGINRMASLAAGTLYA
jgi:hypothetical protein